jgi:ribosomal-protein-serine acetyltransferase
MFRAEVRPGLELRLLEERHAPEVFALADRDRDFLRPWLPWVDATQTEDDSLAFIRSTLEQFASGDAVTAGMWLEGRFAGVIGTHRINRLYNKVELGYWVGESFQGKGVVTDSCRRMITYLFEERELNRVEIHCAVENEKSIAIPKRLGFKLEGTLRDGDLSCGRYRDLHVFGMLRREWRTSRER